MKIEYDDALRGYMQKHNKSNILVDIASTDNCDFDVTELYLRFISQKHADRILGSGKGFKAYDAPVGQIIFPQYKLNISDTIRVSLKSFLFIKWLKQDGVKL